MVVDVVSIPVDVAVKTVGAVVDVTAYAAAAGVHAATRSARPPPVTFVDLASGAVVRVDWAKGLTLRKANAAAGLAVERAVKVLRDGRVIHSTSRPALDKFALAPGDMVQIDMR